MVNKPFESKIQDIVYNVDVGIGLRLIKAGLYFLVVLVIMALYTATQFRGGLSSAEAMDYAQLGRNLMMGQGFTTKNIRPASMWYLIENSRQHDPQIRRHPDIVHPPLYAYTLAGVFRGLQDLFMREKTTTVYPPERVMMGLGHVCTLLTGLLVFLIARRLFDDRTALLGVSLYFLSETVWQVSVSGTGIALGTLLVVLAAYLLLLAGKLQEEGRPAWLWAVLVLIAAVVGGLATLTRYGLVVFTPALALLARYLTGPRGRRWGWIYLVVALAVVAPWLVRNQLVSGGPLGLAPYLALNGADPVAENDFERTLAPKLSFETTTRELQLKLLGGLAGMYNNSLRTLGDGLLIGIFLTTFFYRFAREPVHRLRWCLALALVLMLPLGALYGQGTAALLFAFWPFVILYALAFFLILVERLQLPLPIQRIGVHTVFVLLTALPLILRLLPPREGTPYPPYYPPYITHVCRMIKPDELLCSDMPWATAWYGDRNTLLLPVSIDEFYEINDYTKRISGIYFTTLTRDLPYVRTLMTGSFRTWFPLLEGKIPSDFPLTQGFPLNNLDQLFLTDRPRWEEL